MKKVFIFAALAACAGALFAQVPQGKTAQEPESKPAAVQPKKAPAPAPAPAQVKPAPKAAEDSEESVVMIDSRTDPEDARAADYAADAEDPRVPGGLPSSYGQCRGVISEGGRSVLVFESLDDGTLSFVQVVLGKSNVTWKLVDQVRRSAD